MAKKTPKSVLPTTREKRDFQRAFFSKIASDDCLRAVLNHLGNTRVVVKDCEGRFVWVSDNVPRRHGFESPADMVGLDDFDINPPRLARKYRSDDQTVLQSGEPMLGRIELAFDENGMLNWYVTNKTPLCNRDGEAIGLAATIQEYAGVRNVPRYGADLRPLVDYILEHIGEPLNASKLAALAGVSPRQIERRFRNAIGMSPTEFLIRARIDDACRRLLAGNEPLATIAIDLGFYDQCVFTRLFRRHLGMTPGEYRSTRGNQNAPSPGP